MANYFLDTEFLEGTQKTFFGKSKPTIDLISIGLVSEDGREYYAISKDFNLKEAWNRYDLKEASPAKKYMGFYEEKEYWIRENVLKPIWKELSSRYLAETTGLSSRKTYTRLIYSRFSYDSLSGLIGIYGKPNKQIAEEVKIFVANRPDNKTHIDVLENEYLRDKPIFYGYFCDYDWVVFCWIFGKMIDLPKGFPMYCRDLKQTLDEKVYQRKKEIDDNGGRSLDFDNALKLMKCDANFPKQDNTHNALSDARFTMELYKFLQKI